MFARFIQTGPSLPQVNSRDLRAIPTLPNKTFVPELEFDRRVGFWALTRSVPPTATVRDTVFEHHVRTFFEGNNAIKRSLAQLASLHPTLANKISGLPVMVGETARDSLRRVAVRNPQASGRLSVVIDHFRNDFLDSLAQTPHHDIRIMLDYIGINAVVDRVVDLLRAVSSEHMLATQLHQTALSIRRMEGQITAGTLPEEDMFELKLRRDLFAADLRALTRLVKTTLRG